MPNDQLYSLIDISEFNQRSKIVNRVYYFIIQSAWSVNSMMIDSFLTIGNISDIRYSMCVNGSVRFIRNCDINGNLSVIGNTQLNNLTVFGDMDTYGNIKLINANISNLTASYVNISADITVRGNTFLNNVSISNGANISATTNISTLNVQGKLNVSGFTTLVGVNVSGQTNVSKLLVQNEVNIFGPTTMTNVYIQNGLSVLGSTFLNNVSISNGANISGQVNVSSLYVQNNMSVSGFTSLLNTNISGQMNASSLYTNNLNVDNLSANNRVLFNNGLDVNNEVFTANKGVLVRASNTTVVTGNEKFTTILRGSVFADRIVCNDISAYEGGGQSTALNNAAISVYSKTEVYNSDTFYFLAGFDAPLQTVENITVDNILPILFSCFGQGTFIYGLTNYENRDSTFDLSANNASTGITYNGPINVGQNQILNEFNVNATSIHFGGGDMILDNNLLIGGNITSTSDKRLKENITPLKDCLTKIKHISGYSFTRNDLEDKNKKYLGLLAQEVEEVFPDLVTEINNTKSINYQSFVAVLLECIKELNDKLENKILT